MKPLRLGMVGGGQGAFIGAVHRMAARLDGDYALVAMAPSSDPARAQASGAELGLAQERVYSDYRSMADAEAKRRDGIEVVAIVVPNHLHAPAAEAFIRQGIHIICDKPLTTSVAEGERLEKLAREHKVRFLLTHNYSGYPLVRAARQMVADGALGDIRVVQVEYAQDWLATPLEASGQKQAAWRTDPALAGPAGCLGDIGSHAAHLAEFVTGKVPSEISAELTSFVANRRVDDHVQVQMRYANGARGLLWASQVATGEENALRLRVYGTKASLRWEQENPNELWLQALGQPSQRLTRGSGGLPSVAASATRIPPGHPEGFIEAFAQLYRDFAVELRSLQRGDEQATTLPGLADGVRSLRFIEACLRSSRENSRWEAV